MTEAPVRRALRNRGGPVAQRPVKADEVRVAIAKHGTFWTSSEVQARRSGEGFVVAAPFGEQLDEMGKEAALTSRPAQDGASVGWGRFRGSE